MGVDGNQILTIHGPPADLDAIQAAGGRLPDEDAAKPLLPLEGVDQELFLPDKGRYTYFAYNDSNGLDPEPMKRIHARKLVIHHTYRNRTEYSFFLLTVMRYPKCCLINEHYTENGACERVVIRATPRGTLHVSGNQWRELERWHTWGRHDFRKTRYPSDYGVPPFTCTFTTPLDTSCVHYSLSLTGIPERIGEFATEFRKKGANVVVCSESVSVGFITKTCNPERLIAMLRTKYPECSLDGKVHDEKGHYVLVLEACGYEFVEYTTFTKKEERTLNDFSLVPPSSEAVRREGDVD